ncbi:tetratricopeptide repeat protein [Dapis sp. BLCC M126]|uniref:tetratricopeptide repeat protein n=1 Tax=Dapis sp. BLCC M126 TaxID=3400189 RepID=UPI003CF9E34E
MRSSPGGGTRYNLGIIFYHQGNLPAAFTHYQQDITLDPHNILSHYNLAIILQQLRSTRAGNLYLSKSY